METFKFALILLFFGFMPSNLLSYFVYKIASYSRHAASSFWEGWFFGWLVGWFLGGPCSVFPTTVEFYRKASCRGRNKNADENARKILLLKRHYESVRISFA